MLHVPPSSFNDDRHSTGRNSHLLFLALSSGNLLCCSPLTLSLKLKSHKLHLSGQITFVRDSTAAIALAFLKNNNSNNNNNNNNNKNSITSISIKTSAPYNL
jgi:hypothetical protein